MPTLPTRAAGEASFVEDAAASLIDLPAGSGRLLAVLGALLDRPQALASWLTNLDAAAVAARSYWHHNGFAKLVLHQAADFRVRLHVWPAGADRLGESNPHGHRWAFASSVLCGDGLRSTTWREAAGGLPFVRYGYVGKQLTPLANAHLHPCDNKDVRTHDRYIVTTEAIHTIAPLGRSLVATLVVQGPAQDRSTSVFCPSGSSADQPGLSIVASDTRDLVDQVLAAPDAPWEA